MESNKLLGEMGSPFKQDESYGRLISNVNCRESWCMYLLAQLKQSYIPKRVIGSGLIS
jgi:hypothetical protein